MDPTPTIAVYASILTSKIDITNVFPSTNGLGPGSETISLSTPALSNTTENSSNDAIKSRADEEGMTLPWNAVTTASYSVVILLGVVGNFLVISTLVRRSDMRSPCNLLLASIAVADFAVAIFSTPIRILELYFGWPLGKWGCHILSPLQDVFVSVSVVTHTAIALERHRDLTFPFKLKLSRKKVKLIVIIIWLSCYVLIGLPQSVFSQFAEWQGKAYCWPQWPDWPSTSKDFRIGYELFLVIVFIAAPLLIQTFSYIRVIHILRLKNGLYTIQSRCDSFESSFSTNYRQYKRRIKKKRKLLRMLIVLMVLFQVCYIPRGVAMLLFEFVPSLSRSNVFNNIDRAIMILYYVKHTTNPVILWFMSRDFHSSFKAITTCCVFHRS